MAPDTHAGAPVAMTGPGLQHCPHCRGAVRPGAPWCTQCWADLRPPPAPQAESRPDPRPGSTTEPAPATQLEAGDRLSHVAVGPASAGLDAVPKRAKPAGWPCGACGEANPVELDACAACGSGFLAAMRADEPPMLALPGVGDITRLSRGQRLGAAAGVAAAFALLVLVLGLLFG